MEAIALVALLAGVAMGLAVGRLVGRRADAIRPATARTAADGTDEAASARAARTGDDAGPRRPPSAVPPTAEPPLDAEGLTLVAALTTGVVHLDDRLTVSYANAAAGVLLDRPPDGLTGRTAMEAFLDHSIEALLEAALAGRPGTIEVQTRGRDGRTLVLRARRSPATGVWLVLDDVSELRRLQQIRAEFIDNLSHELRTPLTTVSLLAETLARDAVAAGDAVPPRMRDRIDKIEEETGHLVQMVNELLDLSRIESGPPLVLLDDVDAVSLATSTAGRLRLFAERQGVRLSVDAPDPVPHVLGNEERLGQALLNLLHNAVKFSPDGGDVTIRVAAADGLVTIAVEDHGMGIPKVAQPRIFERFYKVDRARVRGGGTGLGLSIARHIVEGHGGRIRLESEEGRGSKFLVELPAAGSPAVHPLEPVP